MNRESVGSPVLRGLSLLLAAGILLPSATACSAGIEVAPYLGVDATTTLGDLPAGDRVVDIGEALNFPDTLPPAVARDLGAVVVVKHGDKLATGFVVGPRTVYTAGHVFPAGCDSAQIDAWPTPSSNGKPVRVRVDTITTDFEGDFEDPDQVDLTFMQFDQDDHGLSQTPGIAIDLKAAEELQPGQQLYNLSAGPPADSFGVYDPVEDPSARPSAQRAIFIGFDRKNPTVGYIVTNIAGTGDPLLGNVTHGESGSASVLPDGEGVGDASRGWFYNGDRNDPGLYSTTGIEDITGVRVLINGKPVENIGLAAIQLFTPSAMAEPAPTQAC